MRLFVAAGIPDGQRESLARALEPLKLLVPDARWTSADSWHVTLKFLGEVSETQLDEVQEVLEDSAARAVRFPSHLTEPGAFPGVRRPGVLWMGLADPAGSFRNLAGRLERKFEKAGFRRENRPFRPHLTLARMGRTGTRPATQALGDDPGGVRDFLDRLSRSEVDRSVFQIEQIVLLRSHMQPGGSVYEPRLTLSLGPK